MVAFNDFFLVTRAALASSPEELHNQSSKYHTYFLPKMLKGLSKKQTFQAGSKMVDYAKLDQNSNFQNYSPMGELQYQSSNSMTQLEMNWRCWLTYMTWTDHELILNNGADEKEKMKNLKRVKEQELEQGWFEGMEDMLWATPDSAAMESGTVLDANAKVGKPYSLRVFCTKDGAAPSSTNGGVTGSGGNWTTRMTVSGKANWANQYVTYDSTKITTALLNAFDDMFLRVQWEAPESSQQYTSDTKMNKQTIVASRLGVLKMVEIARGMNDTLQPRANFGYENGKVSYAGMPLKWVGALDTIDATDDAAGKFNYRWFNFNNIRPVFHTQRYRYRVPIVGDPRQPFAHVILEDTWGNLWCDNLRENGFISAT